MFCGILRCPKCGAELDIEHDLEYPDDPDLEMECHSYSFPIYSACPKCGVAVQCVVALDISGITAFAEDEDSGEYDWENATELEAD